MKKFVVNIFFVCILSCTSCSVSDEEKRIDFALAAIEENILSTDYTARIEITSGAIDENVNTGDEDIVAVKYSANILERYKGEKLNRLVFTEFVEKSEGVNDYKSGILVISLCKDKDGDYYLPDIGYEFSDKSILIEKAKEIKILLNNKKNILPQQGENNACDY